MSPNSQLVRLLLDRLEHISVDSHWAHRAGGMRGSLLSMLEKIEGGQPLDDPALNATLTYAFQILERAAREKTR